MKAKTDTFGNLKDLKNLYRGNMIYRPEYKGISSFFSYQFVKKGEGIGGRKIVSYNSSLDGSGRETKKTFTHVHFAERLKYSAFVKAAIQGLILKKGMSIA
jgi:hypothetical protein